MRYAAILYSALASIIMAGCGGGGGDHPQDQTSAGVPVQPAPSGSASGAASGSSSQRPTNKRFEVMVKPLASPFSPSSPSDYFYVAVNDARVSQGVGAVTASEGLSAAAQAHLAYWEQNQGNFTDAEFPGAPGYTGKSPSERALAAGYVFNEMYGVKELYGSVWGAWAQPKDCYANLVSKLENRVALMAGWRDIGFAYKSISLDQSSAPLNVCIATLSVASGASGQYPAGGTVSTSPADSEMATPVAWNSSSYAYLSDTLPLGTVGYPILVSFDDELAAVAREMTADRYVNVSQIELLDAGGNVVDVALIYGGLVSTQGGFQPLDGQATTNQTPSGPQQGQSTPGDSATQAANEPNRFSIPALNVLVIPRSPLNFGSVYTLSIRATAVDATYSRDLSFRTVQRRK